MAVERTTVPHHETIDSLSDCPQEYQAAVEEWISRYSWIDPYLHQMDPSTREYVRPITKSPLEGTLIIPIHNEPDLDVHFKTLLLSLANLPQDMKLQIILSCNGCTDGSYEKSMLFASQFGQLEPTTIPDECREYQTSRVAYTARREEVTVRVINSSTGSKSLAINNASAFARQAGHRIVMSIDSDSYLMPDTIWNLYAHLHFHIFTRPDQTVLVSGGNKYAMKTTGNVERDNALKKFNEQRNFFRDNETEHIAGSIYGWDELWRYQTGGTQGVILEDYELKLRTMITGTHHKKYPAAEIWRYMPNCVWDSFIQSARFVEGRVALLDYFKKNPAVESAVREMITNERYYMNPSLLERAQKVIHHAIINSDDAAWILANGLFWEGSRAFGMMRYHQNPTNTSWTRLGSTRKNHA